MGHEDLPNIGEKERKNPRRTVRDVRSECLRGWLYLGLREECRGFHLSKVCLLLSFCFPLLLSTVNIFAKKCCLMLNLVFQYLLTSAEVLELEHLRK